MTGMNCILPGQNINCLIILLSHYVPAHIFSPPPKVISYIRQLVKDILGHLMQNV